MPKSYRAYVGTSTLPDICKTQGWLPGCAGLNPAKGGTGTYDIPKTQSAPAYSPKTFKPSKTDWISDKDEDKATTTTVKAMAPGNRILPVTGATSHDVDTSGDDLQRYLPYIVAGGAGLFLVMMMFSMM